MDKGLKEKKTEGNEKEHKGIKRGIAKHQK